MSDSFGMARQLAGNALRFGWYSGINWLADRQASRLGEQRRAKPSRPVPGRQALMSSLRQLFMRDAQMVRDGFSVADAAEPASGLSDHLARLRLMFSDIPDAVDRRRTRDASTVEPLASKEAVPDYFAQDFHFQKGGYLAEDSARLYDVQVETLFYGSAGAMRRSALRPIGAYMLGRDQRNVSLLDVACGTGRLLREIRLVYPAMKLTGLDLSKAYLKEAASHIGALRRVDLLSANAEAIPLPDESQDLVTTVFLFHELPGEVRRKVAHELARVLKPGGQLVFIDSLQMGDKPDWDGLLETFPQRFHEPFYRHYAIDNLDAIFTAAGLQPVSCELPFLAKLLVYRKP